MAQKLEFLSKWLITSSSTFETRPLVADIYFTTHDFNPVGNRKSDFINQLYNELGKEGKRIGRSSRM